MPIRSRDDAAEVEDRIARFFSAQPDERPRILRRLFAEVLDFPDVDGAVSLSNAPDSVELPDTASRIAQIDGVHVLYVALSDTTSDRINKREAAAAVKLISDELGDDLLFLFTNKSASQLHFIHPQFGSSATPTLRRMVVERDLPRRTAVQQVSNIYWNHQELGDIRAALDQAFDVEPVTKDFFKQYKALFKRAESLIADRTGFADPEDCKQFVQTLFNRLMFVYFLSRKGWLKYERNSEWDTDYLNALWDAYDAHPEHDNFYEDRLTFLFFEGLNDPDSRDLRRGVDFLIGDVPFLNGGLFEEDDLDKQAKAGGIEVPDDAIRPLMTDLFDRFNFTVMESTPFDIEVAVDPEMLGKVFEELITERHDSGAYYTPRPVVSLMCREALKGYLESHLSVPDSLGDPLASDSTQDPSGSPREAGTKVSDPIAAFVDDHDASGLSLADARAISQALDEVTVVDPACGSGAYLVGMMQELVELQTALYSDQLKQDARSLYQLKLHIIERNLYGVDLDPFAVNIAMLRLWLSLAIEYEHDQPEPLPNLDFKILEGDSLLGPDPSETGQQGVLGYDGNRVAELRNLKQRYMTESDPGRKISLREAIEQAESDIRDQLSHFAGADNALDWRIDFAEVIAEGGFDIVVANPPYVESRGSSLTGELKDAYQARIKDDWGASLPRGSDLLIYFFATAAKLLSAKGRSVFITQNSWLNTDYGQAFQRFTLGRFTFSRIIDSEGKLFDSSTGPKINAIICLFSREPHDQIDFGMMDRSLTVTPVKSIAPNSNYKWGTLFAMPDSLGTSLTQLEELAQVEMDVELGQGLNFPKRELNGERSKTPMFLGNGDFAALAADATGPPLSTRRAGRVPALLMPRGVGDRYFCTFNACRAYSWSGVEVYLPDDMWLTDTHYCLWMYLNSSLAWLFREVTGRKNLGGGMLKAEATDLKRLPIRFEYDFGTVARDVYAQLSHRRSLPVGQELYTPEHLKIDAAIGDFLGISDEMPAVREDLVQLVKFRTDRSSS